MEQLKMISKLINNIMNANDEHRGICQSNLIRVELDQIIEFLNANDISFGDEQEILEMLYCELNLKGDWKVFLTHDKIIELIIGCGFIFTLMVQLATLTTFKEVLNEY